MQYLINYDLFESRGNPIETRYALHQLEKYANDPDVFISYRHMEKIGINPTSKYNTPNGIYAYNLKLMMDKNKRIDNLRVPFAGENMWIYAFKPKNTNKVLYLDRYNQSQLKKDRIKLARVMLSQFKKDPIYKRLNRDHIRKLFLKILSILKTASEYMNVRSDVFGSKIWNMTRVTSIIIEEFKKIGLIKLFKSLTTENIVDISKSNRKHSINLWSKIFIAIDYHGVVDPGYGIIHINERSQAVFFNRAFIKVIDKIKNTDVSPHTLYNNDKEKVRIALYFKNRGQDGRYYVINDDGSVDINGDFKLYSNERKLPFKFNKVKGHFDCSNSNLTSLEGAPEKVGGDFNCGDNKLTNLKGAPKEVGWVFKCYNNKLTSLEGAPKTVGGNFNCSNNRLLNNLYKGPIEVGGHFECYGCDLTSLKGAPQKINRNFICSRNNLTNLEGAPREVGGDFECSQNELTSLRGAPKEVGGNFDCLANFKLTSLEGAPRIIGKMLKSELNPEYMKWATRQFSSNY